MTGDGTGNQSGVDASGCADKTVPGPSIFRPPPGSSLLIKFDEGGCKLYDTAPGHLVSAPWECILKLSERSSFYQNTEPRKLDLEKRSGKCEKRREKASACFYIFTSKILTHKYI